MSLRLLSFLNEIERTLLAGANASNGNGSASEEGSWEISRMANYDSHLARMTLTPRPGDTSRQAGSIFLQAFELADGVACLKASLHWKNHDRLTLVTVHAKKAADWQQQAMAIARAWFSGPPPAIVERSMGAANAATASAPALIALAS
jgi:hypothetical protein